MHRYRRTQIITICALVVAIVTLGVGFAAFSTTLNISSSANVSPNSDDFKVQFSTTEYAVDTTNSSCKIIEGMGTNGGIGGIGCVKSNSISDMAIVFTQPGQSVDFRIYIHNTGQYDAYLKSIMWNNIVGENTYKKCAASTTDSTAATPSLVSAACEGITISYDYNGVSYDFGDLSGLKLEIGQTSYLDLHVLYEGARADGPFNVEFGNISLEYGTVDNEPGIISFTIGGMTYQAIDGMTWREWIDSDYNVQESYVYSKFMVDDEYVYRISDYNDPMEWSYSILLYSGNYDDMVSPDDLIMEYDYITK